MSTKYTTRKHRIIIVYNKHDIADTRIPTATNEIPYTRMTEACSIGTYSKLMHRLIKSAEIAVVLGSLYVVLAKRPHCQQQ